MTDSTPFLQRSAEVVENLRLADRTYRIRVVCPEVARACVPGQFLMLRLPATTDPLMGRPFAFYDTCLDDSTGQPTGLDVVYLVVGKLTGRLTEARLGDRLDIWGPLGQGFPALPRKPHVALVAGGIGQTPFLAYTRALLGSRTYGDWPTQTRAQRVTLYYGMRTASLAAGVDDFRAAGAEVRLASDDGSLGFPGRVTQLLEQDLPDAHLIGCGPEPMLRALAGLASSHGLPCHVSLETPMACGVGICFSCVTRVRTADGWDYRRVCMDGPVFDAATLHWGE